MRTKLLKLCHSILVSGLTVAWYEVMMSRCPLSRFGCILEVVLDIH